MRTQKESEILITKIIFMGLYSFILIVFFIHCYSEFILRTSTLTPINQLPSVKGKITSISNCTPAKGGWINRVTLKEESGEMAHIYTPCLSNHYSKNLLIGKSLTSIHEKFDFITLQKEYRILLTIDNITIVDLPDYRRNELKEKSTATALEVIKIPFLVATLTIISLYIFYLLYIRRVIKGHGIIEKLRKNSEEAFNMKNQNVKIISRSESFNSTPKYSEANYYLEIYYKTSENIYWKFKSDGIIHKTSVVPDDIAKIKWPSQ